jgi:hypothetical protein
MASLPATVPTSTASRPSNWSWKAAPWAAWQGAKLRGRDVDMRELVKNGMAWAFNGVAGMTEAAVCQSHTSVAKPQSSTSSTRRPGPTPCICMAITCCRSTIDGKPVSQASTGAIHWCSIQATSRMQGRIRGRQSRQVDAALPHAGTPGSRHDDLGRASKPEDCDLAPMLINSI